MKLAIGSVQFGTAYGVANKSGKVPYTQVRKIIEVARSNGVDLIDTAISYGNSEHVLGEVGINDFKVVTKLPACPDETNDVKGWVEQRITESLCRLKIDNLYGVLVHNPMDLLGNNRDEIFFALKDLQEAGLIKKIGVSAYDPKSIFDILSLCPIGLVQAPLNLVDRRLEKSGCLKVLKDMNVEVHVRSVFLQGLLLLNQEDIPSKFNKWNSIWQKWHNFLSLNRIAALPTCLDYPLSVSGVNRVVVGIDSFNQFSMILKSLKYPKIEHDLTFMISDDEKLINPTCWAGL